ncbi:MAG: glycosyl hydrolase [Bacteroidetes bacterium]|nr:glycosyl hydrolase [Bacteroidota bacterium]
MKSILTSILLFTMTISVNAQNVQEYFQPLKFRNIGPFRGGRSVSSTGVIGDPLTYYMGTTGGGLWKTTDAGQHWKNISDGFFKTGSVGAVAVSASNTNVVYVGMGEHAVRGVMTSYGDGVYKSTDAGKTWTHLGLEATQHISRIVIHPTNPDIVWVAAQGALFGPTKDRGIYKTIDGGKSWKKVLFVNELTGGVELSIDANNPQTLYAAMWHHQRKPWVVVSGGSGSGLYKSMDGGETWEIIHEGLPDDKGKMAIAVAPSNSDKVYALIEADSQKDLGGLFVSEDAGKSWTRVSDDNRLTQRAWYYIEVFINPQNENEVYVLSAQALKSIDGGKTWEEFGTNTHGDFHDLWINPKNSQNMIISNDGGGAISFDNAKTWSTQDNMPTGQFYRINTDNLFPYNIYAGQQDNTSIKIAHLSQGRSSIGREDWTYSAGGESAFLAFDPDKPDWVMGGSYLGYIELLQTSSKVGRNVMAAPIQYLGLAARDMKYLFNWNAPIVRSSHHPNRFYHGAQMVLVTDDMGQSWRELSPDLTRNIDAKQGKGGEPLTVEAVGAENYGTLSYMMESPHEKGVIWTASDDGFVYLTRDDGQTWSNVTPKNLQECLVNAIEVSPHDAATAYIATTRYKFNDYTPALYKTTDYGKTWTNISNGIPYGAFTRVIREDPTQKGLLFAGTETGLYVSWNDGKNWHPLQRNLPVSPITDLKIHQGDLIVATSGRAFWILDDLKLLSQTNQNPGQTKLFEPEDAVYGSWGSPMNGNTDTFDGTDSMEGVNPANGVVFYYNISEDLKNEVVKLEIKNENGLLVNRFTSVKDTNFSRYDGGPPPTPTLSKKAGLNRFVWDMRYPIVPGVSNVYIEANYRGHRTPPGNYTATLTVGDVAQATSFKITNNPLYDVKPEDFQEFDRIMTDMEQQVTEMHKMVNTLKAAQEQLKSVLIKISADNSKTEIYKQGMALVTSLSEWDGEMVQRMSKAYDDVENFENKFSAEYMFLLNHADSSLPKVNLPTIERKKELDATWVGLKSKGIQLKAQLKTFNQVLWQAGIGAVQLEND